MQGSALAGKLREKIDAKNAPPAPVDDLIEAAMPHSGFIPAEVHVTNATDAMAKLKKRTAPLKVRFYPLGFPNHCMRCCTCHPHSIGLQVLSRRRFYPGVLCMQAFLGSPERQAACTFLDITVMFAQHACSNRPC